MNSLSNGGLGVRPGNHLLLLNKSGRVNYNVFHALQGRFTLPQPSSQGFEYLMNWDEALRVIRIYVICGSFRYVCMVYL